MSSDEWHELPNGTHRERETFIRAWVPGDGLMCSAGSARSSVRCTTPAAVLRTKFIDAGWHNRNAPTTTLRVLCAIHAAEAVRNATGEKGQGIKTEAQRIAKEQIIATHWDEYLAAVEDALAEQQSRYLSMLPESLRTVLAQTESGAS